MKRNKFAFSLVLLFAMLCVQVSAQTSTFTYTASHRLDRFDEYSYFVGADSVVSHDFDEATLTGTVVYAGEVTEVGKLALMFNSDLTSIVIPEGVTKIGFHAFYACMKLTNITLPKSLTTIDGLAFDSCSGLANGKFIVDDLAWWCGINFADCYSNPLFYAKHFYSAKTVHKVCQPVFVQGTSHKQACDDGQQDGYLVGEQVAAEIDDGPHDRTCEPTHEWPVFDNRLISLLGRLVQSPERQSSKEDKGCPNTVIPFCGVDRYLHGCRSFYFYGYSANHQNYFIRTRGNILVHPAHQVGEPALDGIRTNPAGAYLVGNEDEGGIL